MTTAYLGLGSNVDAKRHIRSAIIALEKEFGTVNLSPIYLSQAVGFDGDPFINLVASVDTHRSALDLREWLRELEDRHDRQRDVPKFSDRTLDIDILLYGTDAFHEDGLEIPRPEILEFAHVLKPLADLAPELEYPGMGVSLGEIWTTRGDHSAPLELISRTDLDVD